jgi:hypothetical protein
VGSATYAEAGSFVPVVTVSDSDGNVLQTANTTINVVDAALTDTTTAVTLNATRGTTTGTVVLATFTDGNPNADASDFTLAVNWGGAVSGTPTFSIVLVSRSATTSTWQVVGNATYSADGNFVVAVTITDVDGSSLISKKTRFHVTG